MSQNGSHVRNRHEAQMGLASTRDTHGPPGFSPSITGMSYGDARDGEQAHTPDISEAVIETGHFNHDAYAPKVNNNPVSPVDADVIIDESGITIRNGAIFLEDYAGESVLTPAGFGGSWSEFIVGGVYNGEFNVGEFGTWIQTASMVNTASTIADYEASLSGSVPKWVLEARAVGSYWNLDDTGGDTRLRFVHDFQESVLSQVSAFQDVPVLSGYAYDLFVDTNFDGPDGTWSDFSLELECSVEWRDENHAFIALETSGVDLLTSIQPALGQIHLPVGAAPNNARYARIIFDGIGSITGGSGANVGYSEVRSITFRPRLKQSLIEVGPWTVLGSSGYHEIQNLVGSVPHAGMLHIEAGNGVIINNTYGANPALILNQALAFTSAFSSPDASISRGTVGRLDVADYLRLGTGRLEFGSAGARIDGDTTAISFLNSGSALIGKARGMLLATSYSDPTPPDRGIQFGPDVSLAWASANLLAMGSGDSLEIPNAAVWPRYTSGDHFADSAGPNLYPGGLTLMSVTAGAGWPGSGTVLTLNQGASSRVHQIYMQVGATRLIQYRQRSSAVGDGTWTAWGTL